MGWGAPEIIQAEWDSWIDAPTLEEWGYGFPASTGVADEYHPARYWLQAHLNAQLAQSYPGIPEGSRMVSVEPHELGYRVVSLLDCETYIIMHEEIHQQDFCLRDVLAVIREGLSEQEVYHKLQTRERCHRRHLALMLCALRPGKPCLKGSKSAKSPRDTIYAVERNAMRTKDFT